MNPKMEKLIEADGTTVEVLAERHPLTGIRDGLWKGQTRWRTWSQRHAKGVGNAMTIGKALPKGPAGV